MKAFTRFSVTGFSMAVGLALLPQVVLADGPEPI